ncbi:Type III secretion bridge between inner and outermembrane lipoprotein (YscJ,HrcJ,EscJ, PscJ) [Pseudomonas chlororaphis]|uniref:type III secretion system inner membrane ring lipoprotein SctJ n=1 Tax=Pseudomonas chlororaphis TaxID=587753 RepID=UPI000F584D3C|nr:type III secretion inner membrane ring lipoprotein SctJ [Pseudomonas chlororaphis]AZD09535.1 Type III secretion bridge between inner and outermembrane lipoprotein (YscJ,HrcJ,EscJ, PscJ) [Pseudomonas chlororaphis]
MTRGGLRLGCIGVLVLMLSGCKVELYSELSEADANQMLALLLLRNIDASKEIAKGGLVTIKVDKTQFINAVELLRQEGLPREKVATLEDLFPSGQLVTSPVQEHAKILYLKEQQLEKMLQAMDGVISAHVSIGEGISQNPRETAKPSASVFIKYSPERNLLNRETAIKSLIFNSVPNLQTENISIVLQAADYRYQPLSEQPGPTAAPLTWLERNRLPLMLLLAALAVLILATTLGQWLRSRSQ